MRCIVGLGNPGTRYRDTRHNIGFLAVERLHRSFGRIRSGADDLAEWSIARIEDEETLLLLPQTYMNASGEAVGEAMQRFTITTEELLVIYDDFQIPFGTLRLRPHGSDGGHNGLASIIGCTGTDRIPRLRIGVGGTTLPDEHTHASMADYVLSPFTTVEQGRLPDLLGHCQDACVRWLTKGIGPAMNAFNRDFFTPVKAG